MSKFNKFEDLDIFENSRFYRYARSVEFSSKTKSLIDYLKKFEADKKKK